MPVSREHSRTDSPSGAGGASLRSSIKIAPGAVVCGECELRGDITIGAKTVIHPRARILAEAGPIIIGESNLIEELSCICNRRSAEDAAPGGTESLLIIGNNNVFEVGSRCEALKVGDSNVLEVRSFVGRGTELSNGCTVGAACRVDCREALPENCVLYGESCERRLAGERPPPQTLQLDFLTKILPNYHHIKKASASSRAAANPAPAARPT